MATCGKIPMFTLLCLALRVAGDDLTCASMSASFDSNCLLQSSMQSEVPAFPSSRRQHVQQRVVDVAQDESLDQAEPELMEESEDLQQPPVPPLPVAPAAPAAQGGQAPPRAKPTPQPAAPLAPMDDNMQVLPIAPFGKEDTARELQDLAARTQDTLVDAVENAEVAEIKRAVFRSLTRLRAAQIKEFDTIARLETQAIDEYNDNHHYRKENPLQYLASDEPGINEDKYTSFHE
eukprot:CAMPEP_0178429846 /NCGR_PEP_ID=MMETSP0689_2-20121128/31015_1 /TAXON_ID=160604 /ORGANISM="Amphidinium massartii, Strain CS-259" /LENGTH=233 /DNA_ID=CAMNT_0020051685 /DNA_START=111 /DNA_END=812 /DNA_ORIENTATION=-